MSDYIVIFESGKTLRISATDVVYTAEIVSFKHGSAVVAMFKTDALIGWYDLEYTGGKADE